MPNKELPKTVTATPLVISPMATITPGNNPTDFTTLLVPALLVPIEKISTPYNLLIKEANGIAPIKYETTKEVIYRIKVSTIVHINIDYS